LLLLLLYSTTSIISHQTNTTVQFQNGKNYRNISRRESEEKKIRGEIKSKNIFHNEGQKSNRNVPNHLPKSSPTAFFPIVRGLFTLRRFCFCAFNIIISIRIIPESTTTMCSLIRRLWSSTIKLINIRIIV